MTVGLCGEKCGAREVFCVDLKPVKQKQVDDSSFETAECTWLPSPSRVPLFFGFMCLPRPLVSPLTHCFFHLFHSVTFNQPQWCYCFFVFFWERLHYVSYRAFNCKWRSLRGMQMFDEERLYDWISVSVYTKLKFFVFEMFVSESGQIHIRSDVQRGLECCSLFHFPKFLSNLHPAHLSPQSTLSTYLAYQLLFQEHAWFL